MEKPRKGIFERLFGARPCGCCNVRIEEVTDDKDGAQEGATAEEKAVDDGPAADQSSCCGGGAGNAEEA